VRERERERGKSDFLFVFLNRDTDLQNLFAGVSVWVCYYPPRFILLSTFFPLSSPLPFPFPSRINAKLSKVNGYTVPSSMEIKVLFFLVRGVVPHANPLYCEIKDFKIRQTLV
jgi:hypothetical protein